MTTRLLITIERGDVGPEECGDCVFRSFEWVPGDPDEGRSFCSSPVLRAGPIGAGKRHAECLAAGRSADAMQAVFEKACAAVTAVDTCNRAQYVTSFGELRAAIVGAGRG